MKLKKDQLSRIALVIAMFLGAALFYFASAQRRAHSVIPVGLVAASDDDYLEELYNSIEREFAADDMVELVYRVNRGAQGGLWQAEAGKEGKDGVKVPAELASDRRSVQAAQVENLVEQGCQVIIIVGNNISREDVMLFSSIGGRAKFIAVSAHIQAGSYVYIGPMPYDEGFKQGEYLRRVLPEGANILYMRGDLKHPFSRQRLQGFAEGCLLYRTDVKIAAELEGGYKASEAKAVVEEYLARPEAKEQRFDAVVAQNCEMALAAREALIEAGRPAPRAYAINSGKLAYDGVLHGLLDATVAIDLERLGRDVYRATKTLLRGDPARDQIYTPRIVTRTHLE